MSRPSFLIIAAASEGLEGRFSEAALIFFIVVVALCVSGKNFSVTMEKKFLEPEENRSVRSDYEGEIRKRHTNRSACTTKSKSKAKFQKFSCFVRKTGPIIAYAMSKLVRKHITCQ